MVMYWVSQNLIGINLKELFVQPNMLFLEMGKKIFGKPVVYKTVPDCIHLIFTF